MIFLRQGILKHRTEKLLFRSIAPGAASREEELLKLLREGIDFGYLVKIADEKGVSPLVYSALIPLRKSPGFSPGMNGYLSKGGGSLGPAAYGGETEGAPQFYSPSSDAEKKSLRDLSVSYLSASAANSHYKEELIKILAAFKRKDIDVIPLKGLALSKRLYGDIESRGLSVDTDLLVKEGDKASARGILEEAGYSFTPVDELEERKWHHTFHKAGERMVELHWDITMMARSAERIEGLWRGTEYMVWDGIRYLDFKPEELLLYLSAHLTNSDSFRKLKYICDIDRLLEKYGEQMDWGGLTEKALQWRLSGSLYAALKLTREFFGCEFPKEVMIGLKISRPRRLAIDAFANKRVYMSRCLRRAFLDFFFSYQFFKAIEAVSFKDHLALIKENLKILLKVSKKPIHFQR